MTTKVEQIADAGDRAEGEPGWKQGHCFKEQLERQCGAILHVDAGKAVLVCGAQELLSAPQFDAATALPYIGNKNDIVGCFHGSTLCCGARCACLVGGLGRGAGLASLVEE